MGNVLVVGVTKLTRHLIQFSGSTVEQGGREVGGACRHGLHHVTHTAFTVYVGVTHHNLVVDPFVHIRNQ